MPEERLANATFHTHALLESKSVFRPTSHDHALIELHLSLSPPEVFWVVGDGADLCKTDQFIFPPVSVHMFDPGVPRPGPVDPTELLLDKQRNVSAIAQDRKHGWPG